jgi:hypothetical protein
MRSRPNFLLPSARGHLIFANSIWVYAYSCPSQKSVAREQFERGGPQLSGSYPPPVGRIPRDPFSDLIFGKSLQPGESGLA